MILSGYILLKGNHDLKQPKALGVFEKESCVRYQEYLENTHTYAVNSLLVPKYISG